MRPAPADRCPVSDETLTLSGSFRLACGAMIPTPPVRLRFHGRLDAPWVLTMGGISAGRMIVGPAGWWGASVGPGLAIDTDHVCAVGIDFAPDDDRLLAITPDDQARLILAALDQIGHQRLEAVVGASYGGLVGLALAARAPDRLGKLVVLGAAHEPWSLASAWRGIQRRIVQEAVDRGDGDGGLALARQLAMVTYRSAAEFTQRFDRVLDDQGTSDLDRYLIARGAAYAGAMPARRWLSLSAAIDRAWIDPALVAVPTLLIGWRSDQIVPPAQLQALAARLPKSAGLHLFESVYGHDAFLKETHQVATALTPFLFTPASGDNG